MKITARATITIELMVQGENWNEHTSIEQIHREGAELATARVTKLCERYVTLIGRPRIEAVIVPEKR